MTAARSKTNKGLFKYIKRKYLILLVLTVIVIALDQFTKSIVVKRMSLNESIAVIHGIFNITRIHNAGAAFGILQSANPSFRVPFFIITPLLALTAIAYFFRTIPDSDFKHSSALSLIIGGAIGNLVDRLTLNYVVDFLDFHWGYPYHFPAFNVADSAICVGVGVLLYDLLFLDGAAPFGQPRKRVHT